MAKAILEYDLEDLEDNRSMRLSMDAHKLYQSIDDFDNYLRHLVKYSENEVEVMYAERIREKLRYFLDENAINLNNY